MQQCLGAMTSAELIRDGWFGEKEALWPGQRLCLRVQRVVHETVSAFQHILVFDSTDYGRVLVLDGVIQLTERDEFAYQEMIAHLPLFSHPDPRRVLIVGGGDGGVLREVAKHCGVTHITMCEIDPEVVSVRDSPRTRATGGPASPRPNRCGNGPTELTLGVVAGVAAREPQTAKRFFPDSMATAFDDPRLSLVHADAAAYVKDHPGEFDVVIVDSSDPVGPAESLFEDAFFRGLRASLRPSGVICTQGECVWLHLDMIGRVMAQCGPLFAAVDYAYTTVPTYPSGQIGFVLCSNDPASKPPPPPPLSTPHAQQSPTPARSPTVQPARGPQRRVPHEMARSLSYYSAEAHRSAFVLPAFAERALARWRKRDNAGVRDDPDPLQAAPHSEHASPPAPLCADGARVA